MLKLDRGRAILRAHENSRGGRTCRGTRPGEKAHERETSNTLNLNIFQVVHTKLKMESDDRPSLTVYHNISRICNLKSNNVKITLIIIVIIIIC